MTDDQVVYGALGARFSFASDRVDLLELFDRLWTHCRSDDPAQCSIEVIEGSHGWVVAVDGEARARDLADATVLQHLHWEINRLARDAGGGRPLLHAACVSVDGAGIVLAGPSGAGKSTMTLGLCERGADYLSDEIVPVEDAVRGAVAAYPKPLTLRRGAWEFSRTIFPNCAPSVAPLMLDTWFVAPPNAIDETVAAAVVMLQYEPEAPTELHEVDPADALVSLCTQTHRFGEGGADDFEVLANFCRAVPCFTMTTGDLETSYDQLMTTVVRP